jgi:hypothetical protein
MVFLGWSLCMCRALVLFLGWTSYVLCSGGVPGIALGLYIIHGCSNGVSGLNFICFVLW